MRKDRSRRRRQARINGLENDELTLELFIWEIKMRAGQHFNKTPLYSAGDLHGGMASAAPAAAVLPLVRRLCFAHGTTLIWRRRHIRRRIWSKNSLRKYKPRARSPRRRQSQCQPDTPGSSQSERNCRYPKGKSRSTLRRLAHQCHTACHS